MKVWIDQTECMGSGLCSIIEPRLFTLGDDGVSYVLDADGLRPAGIEGATEVPEECRSTVFEATKGCVAACIHVVE